MSDAAAKRRARQTIVNLVLSLAATVGLVIVMVLIVPRDDSNQIQHVDYKKVAAEAAMATERPVIVPEIEAGWWSNSARWTAKPKDGTDASWYVGFVGPDNQYIGMTQTYNTNPTWLALQLNDLKDTGKKLLDGQWSVWVSKEKHTPAKTKDYLLVSSKDVDTILIYGTASEAAMTSFANGVSSQILKVYP
jgi:hypothetical protein